VTNKLVLEGVDLLKLLILLVAGVTAVLAVLGGTVIDLIGLI
jgi:hypothetical protein